MHIFNIHIEFSPQILRNTIEQHIRDHEKAYVCVVDGNVLTMAQMDLQYRKIVQNATINTCDGSSIAMMANKIYGTNYQAYSGPDIFEYYIEKPYKHLLIGNTSQKVEQIKAKVKEKGLNLDMQHIDVPFVPVEKFDYKGIAKQINKIKPDIVWVSLGAPKQEMFIYNIFPYIEQGVFLGIGAAFNFYTGDIRNNKKEVGGVRLIWLERIFKEPKKQWSRAWRYIITIPKILFKEYKISKNIKNK